MQPVTAVAALWDRGPLTAIPALDSDHTANRLGSTNASDARLNRPCGAGIPHIFVTAPGLL